MNRKSYVATAKLLASVYRADRALVGTIIDGLSDIFEADNSRFKPDLFKEECKRS